MKTFLKVLLVICALLAIVAGLAVVALQHYFPPERIRALAVAELQKHLRREIRLSGVSVGWNGLSLDGLEISEPSTFAQGTFVTLKSLSLRPQLRPLLKKQLVIDSLVLAEPSVTLIRQADGTTWNFSDLLSASPEGARAPLALSLRERDDMPFPLPAGEGGRRPGEARWNMIPSAYAAAPAPPGPSALPFQFTASLVEIIRGRLRFVDRSPAQSSAELSDLNVALRHITLTHPISLKASCRAMQEKLSGKIALDGTFDPVQFALEIKTSTIESPGLKAGVTGTMTDLKADSPRVNLAVSLQELAPAALSPFASIPKALQVSAPLSGQVAFKGGLDSVDVQSTLDATAAEVKYGTTFHKPAGEPLTLSAAGTFRPSQSIELSLVSIRAGAVAVSGSGRVEKLSAPAPEFRLHMDIPEVGMSEVSAWIPAMPKDSPVRGRMKGSLDVVGTADQARAAFKLWLGAIPFQGTARYAAGKPERIAIDIKTTGFSLAEIRNVSSLAGDWVLSGRATAEIKVDGSMDAPKVAGRLSLTEVSVKNKETEVSGVSGTIAADTPNALAVWPKQSAGTTGSMQVDRIIHPNYQAAAAKLSWSLTDVTTDFARVNGEAQLSQGTGKLLKAYELAEQSRWAKLLLGPIATVQRIAKKESFTEMGLPALDEIKFESIEGAYRFKRGVASTVRPFHLKGSDLEFFSRGTLELFGDQTLGLENEIRLRAGVIRGDLGRWASDEQGRTIVAFGLAGPAASAKPKWHLEKVIQKAVQKGVEDLLNNKDLQERLRKIFR